MNKRQATDYILSPKRSRSEDDSFENQISFENLLLNAQWSDVNFVFDSPDGVNHVSANKAILANGSDVFAAMFYGELKEKGDITVTDASIDAFKEFLQFFYLNRVQLTIENVAEVMNLGHKYNVIKCVDVCGRFLKGALSADNACHCLNIALLYDQPELKECCETYIAAHSDTVLKSKDFPECDKRVLSYILQIDSLSCSETVIFEACMSWVKAKSKRNVLTKQVIRKHLGELFYEIRFTTMAMKEFDALSTEHDYAFTFAEYKDIMHAFVSPEASSTLFNESLRRRQLQWNEKSIALCDRKGSTSSFQHRAFPNKMEPTKFESNQRILLGTLTFAPIHMPYSFNVTILEATSLNSANHGSTRTLSNFEVNLPSNMETSITLSAPVLIRPGFYYEIRTNSKPPLIVPYYYQYGGLKAEVRMENDLSIKFNGDRVVTGLGLVNPIVALGFNRI